MSQDPGKCGDCGNEKIRVEHPQSRLSVIPAQLKADSNLNLAASAQIAYKVKNPNEYEDDTRCANPTCEEGQKQFEKFLNKTNRGLNHTARLGDWTDVNEKDLNRLQQLSEKANEITTENELSWTNNEVQKDWRRIGTKINTFSTNLETAIETTDEVEHDSDDKVHGREKVVESLDINKELHELNGRVDGIEAVADAEQTTNENDENEEQEQGDKLDEEEQGPIERREAEIEELEEKQQKRIEAREKEIEELNAEIEEIEEKISELKTEKQERITWREDEIDELGEGNEEQIEKLQDEVRNARRWGEKQTDKQRELINDRREQIGNRREKIGEIREEYEDRIDTVQTELSELQEQEEEQAIEAEEETSTERDRDEETGVIGNTGRDDEPPPSTGTATVDSEESEAETATAMANGGGGDNAGDGGSSTTGSNQHTETSGKSEQHSEWKQRWIGQPEPTRGPDFSNDSNGQSPEKSGPTRGDDSDREQTDDDDTPGGRV